MNRSENSSTLQDQADTHPGRETISCHGNYQRPSTLPPGCCLSYRWYSPAAPNTTASQLLRVIRIRPCGCIVSLASKCKVSAGLIGSAHSLHGL
ncbi:hypothetical protein PC116_g19723 [Phytophthora cactorum]|nr:hypothetical protein PC111_g15883 [Phytophthora cactorum]KAG2995713.1 hypothetical protein PC119_g17986 [Phytophthora cactorum]KAG3148335.1 hypothetical protein C6341_g17430 [Phytophthora cactorum]KAG4232035.1 hypothetical protein PC116_g19723 [Phytophthora cactorum]